MRVFSGGSLSAASFSSMADMPTIDVGNGVIGVPEGSATSAATESNWHYALSSGGTFFAASKLRAGLPKVVSNTTAWQTVVDTTGKGKFLGLISPALSTASTYTFEVRLTIDGVEEIRTFALGNARRVIMGELRPSSNLDNQYPAIDMNGVAAMAAKGIEFKSSMKIELRISGYAFTTSNYRHYAGFFYHLDGRGY